MTVKDLEVRVLGPVQVVRGGRQVALVGRTTLTVLAGLAVAPHRVISVDTLIDYVWDADLPANPRAALHNGVSRLRRVLPEGALETLGRGYRLRADADDLDLLRFDRQLAAASKAIDRGHDQEALTALDGAIGLWQEPLLCNVESPSLHREVVPRLTERYLQAVEMRAELCLGLDVPGAMVEELGVVARAYPLREHVTGLLMVGLTRVGRRVDALVAYDSLRRALRDQLGIDPAVSLRDLHVKILRSDPDLAIRARREARRPWCLPGELPGLC